MNSQDEWPRSQEERGASAAPSPRRSSPKGARSCSTARNAEKGAQAVAEIGRPDDVHFVQGDAKVREDCERVVDEAVEHFGRIDILVNNAGGATNHAPVAQLTDEALDDALTWNLWSTFWCSRKAVNYMIPQGWGRIINISSVEGKCGKPGLSIYVIAKHAINGLTKSMAQEVGTTGDHGQFLVPRSHRDRHHEANRARRPLRRWESRYEQLIEYFVEESATKRLMAVDDVAAVAMLLASEAGAGITGSLISIDGGTSPY